MHWFLRRKIIFLRRVLVMHISYTDAVSSCPLHRSMHDTLGKICARYYDVSIATFLQVLWFQLSIDWFPPFFFLVSLFFPRYSKERWKTDFFKYLCMGFTFFISEYKYKDRLKNAEIFCRIWLYCTVNVSTWNLGN